MSEILPKGIVVNTPGISHDIESKDRNPLAAEEIAEFWKVYTTTSRRLLDPTAERLENLWWRIWGSQRRSLKGSTIARLFVEISDGRTFVPLRGPANRYEGSPQWNLHSRRAQMQNNIDTSNQGNRGDVSISTHTVNTLPPILKKNRNQSSSGARPTARFISPPNSEDESTPKAVTEIKSRGANRKQQPQIHLPIVESSGSTAPGLSKHEAVPATQLGRGRYENANSQSSGFPPQNPMVNHKENDFPMPQSGSILAPVDSGQIRSPLLGQQSRMIEDLPENSLTFLSNPSHRNDDGSGTSRSVQGKGKSAEEGLIFQKRPVSPASKGLSIPPKLQGSTLSVGSVPMARSKSQLTLLLQNDQATKEQDPGKPDFGKSSGA